MKIFLPLILLFLFDVFFLLIFFVDFAIRILSRFSLLILLSGFYIYHQHDNRNFKTCKCFQPIIGHNAFCYFTDCKDGYYGMAGNCTECGDGYYRDVTDSSSKCIPCAASSEGVTTGTATSSSASDCSMYIKYTVI